MQYQFSQSQRTAITQGDGATLVLAGPGSGKTSVITGRLMYLIRERKIRPDQILVITFTRAAAGEMRQRFQKLCGERLPVQFGTFHAIFFSILKHAYHYRADQIITPEWKYAFLREILASDRLTEEECQELMDNLLAEISAVKNEQLDLTHYYAKCCGSERFREIYSAYEKKLRENKWIDFDDMLGLTYELLTQRQDHLKVWQSRFRYILVDEVQDMNRLQYEILRLLAAPENELFFVGDDDQSIYQFRGARPELMRSFINDYANAKQLYLKENYRCGEEIVAKAANLISHNKNRFEKQITAASGRKGEVHVEEFSSTLLENRAILEKLRERHAKGVGFSDMAVLFRTNRQSGYLLELLTREGIPFFARERVPILYDHWIARDICAYLKLAAGDRSRSTFLQIMNRPVRYLSRDVLDQPQVDLDSWEAIYEEQPWIARRIAQLAEDLAVLSHMGPFAAMNYVRKGIGYEEFVLEYAKTHGQDAEALLSVVDELQQSAVGFGSIGEWQEHVAAYRLRMQEELKKGNRENTKEGVQILTLHGAKGLEFDSVWLPQLLEGQLPYKKAVLEADIEEERRLLYVGMTRAKNCLYLSHSKVLYNKNTAASRFLQELGAAAVVEATEKIKGAG